MLRDANTDACLIQANAQMAPLDARWQDLNQNWNPSGYYEPAAIRQGVASVQAALSQAFDTLAQAQHSCNEAPGCSWPATSDYSDLLEANNQAQSYIDTAAQAESSAAAVFKTAYVSAPGFKAWAVKALLAASNAGVTSSVTSCLMPWWAGAIASLVQAISAAADVLASILGVAADVAVATLKAGQALATTAKEGIGLIAWLAGNFPLVIGGAVLFFLGRYAWGKRHALKERFQQFSRRQLPPPPR